MVKAYLVLLKEQNVPVLEQRIAVGLEFSAHSHPETRPNPIENQKKEELGLVSNH
jgi:hypothetical protein